MHIKCLNIANHPILKNQFISFRNEVTGKPYHIVAFVGENGTGKTTLLNELFNYSDSEYIVFKEINYSYPNKTGRVYGTFLRQGQLYYSSLDRIKKLLKGEAETYPTESKEIEECRKSPNCFYAVGHIDTTPFGDKAIDELFKHQNDEFIPGETVTKLIDGKTSKNKYDEYSSGEQELIFKLQRIQWFQSLSDFLLIDEPESSLHPRWQKIFMDYLDSCFKISDDHKPQIFIATHSERILESLIKRDDVLIIRMYRDENGDITHENINQMDILLPKVTFAELNYVIFKMDSYEYLNQLYDLIEWKTQKGEKGIDTLIRRSGFYDEKVHHKEWFNEKFNNISSKNIASYCRNYFHHPKDREEPTEQQLHDAIILLRKVVSTLSD